MNDSGPDLSYSDIIEHYDLLVAENNDPVHDPEPLRNYMDKWDGPAFIEQMQLNRSKSVLEIGVGTGRLAVRVAPLCGEFMGVDISSKTVKRANQNLAEYKNVKIICADFSNFDFDRKFDVIYSSLTFMHIKEKQTEITKIAGLLNDAGKFVISIDKNQNEYIDNGTRKIKVYPDTPLEIKAYIADAGLTLIDCYETEFADILVAEKDIKCYWDKLGKAEKRKSFDSG